MDLIEPNTGALALFALFSFVTCLGLIVLSGVFPLATRPDLTRPLGRMLVGLNCLLLAAALWGTLSFGLDHLRWTSAVIVAGMAFLFAPGLFNVWPSRWRDGPAGLLIVMAALATVTCAQTTLA